MTELDIILKDKKIENKIALEVFDKLEAVDIEFMMGNWKGSEVLTGHPMDGALATTGWYGKTFKGLNEVHPLIFYTDKEKSNLFIVEPFKLFSLQEKLLSSGSFAGDFKSDLETSEYKARIRKTEFRGVVSATMLYDELPVNDIFRKIDDNTVLGAMDLKGIEMIYFFLLERAK